MKRLVVDVPDELHKEIKIRAANRMVSIKKWLMMAVFEFIREKELYEIDQKDGRENIKNS